MSKEQFLADLKTMDAVLRNLEILGEAAVQNYVTPLESAIADFLSKL